MCIRVGVRGMELAAQFLDKDPHRAANVRNHGINERVHEVSIIRWSTWPRSDGPSCLCPLIGDSVSGRRASGPNVAVRALL
jgi:hypothetical protein